MGYGTGTELSPLSWSWEQMNQRIRLNRTSVGRCSPACQASCLGRHHCWGEERRCLLDRDPSRTPHRPQMVDKRTENGRCNLRLEAPPTWTLTLEQICLPLAVGASWILGSLIQCPLSCLFLVPRKTMVLPRRANPPRVPSVWGSL